MDLQGKTALITGGGRRVGRAIALHLAWEGVNVLVHYHQSEEAAQETVREALTMSVGAEAIQADLADPAAIDRLFARVGAFGGRLDLLVNSASAFLRRGAQETTLEEWDAVMDVNLRAPFLCSQHAARLMQQGEPGVIVNIADVAGLVPWKEYAAHSVSKAGLIMLTRVLAKSLGPQVRVNAVAPGPVLKPDAMPEARWAALGAHLPLGRTGGPQDVARAVMFLAKSDYITGAVLNVDGGDSLLGSIDLI